MSKVFLSHSHQDKPFARRLAADLRIAGHAVWIDEAEINIGDSLIEKIREGLDQVDHVAAIISSSSVASPWVQRELDIASNRELREKKVVVLPLLLEDVPLPGFLDGKFYGDFRSPEHYAATLESLLRVLGPAAAIPKQTAAEVSRLREQLALANAVVAQHAESIKAHQVVAMKGKSAKLVAAINAANARYPAHAPINATYAFEIGGVSVTLDYLFWAIQKSIQGRGHPMEAILTIENSWGLVEAMLSAYDDLLTAADA